MKICFLAPSGYGKSTAIEILREHFNIKNIKIAEPLYELQNSFYEKIGIDDGNRQDGELLQFYGKKIRKENKKFLLETFKYKLDNTKATIISNDDCRPDDYKFLKDNGFIFIKINGFKRDRDDLTIANSKDKLEWQEHIPFDYEVNNYGSLEEYKENLLNLINKLLVPKCYIIPTQKACNCDCNFCISKSRKYNKDTEFLEVSDKFIENIHSLKKHGVKRFEITGGGEPFLNKNLEEIIFAIKRIIPDSYIKLYTNGNILKKISGIDEIDISVVSDDIDTNNKFMNGNNIELIDKIKFFKDKNIKLRLSIPLIKGGIDNEDKLKKLIDKTDKYIDEYVVRTLYPKTLNIEKLYVDFNYCDSRVIMEKNNDVNNFNGLILWSDNEIYNNWNLLNNVYLNSYLLLKPDSKTYINEIEDLIKERGFEILKKYILSNFKTNALRLYNDKDDNKLIDIFRHLDFLSFLFGDNALLLILDKQASMEEIYFETLKLKQEIRKKYSFTGACDGYLFKNNNISHVNIAHCPDTSDKFNKDLDFLLNSDVKEIDNESFKILKRYRSYDI